MTRGPARTQADGLGWEDECPFGAERRRAIVRDGACSSKGEHGDRANMGTRGFAQDRRPGRLLSLTFQDGGVPP